LPIQAKGDNLKSEGEKVGRYTGPRCKLCRREGVKLFLKGKKCTAKCTLDKRAQVPGQHWQKPTKLSDYGLHLREKQKLCRIYGLMERQFKKCFRRAQSEKGITGENFLRLLERRLDNVVFRLGLASTRGFARQMGSHGHFTVNDKRLDIPSYLVEVGDIIKIGSRSEGLLLKIKESVETSKERGVPSWLSFEENNLVGTVRAFPTRQEMAIPIQEQLIVEFYSK